MGQRVRRATEQRPLPTDYALERSPVITLPASPPCTTFPFGFIHDHAIENSITKGFIAEEASRMQHECQINF